MNVNGRLRKVAEAVGVRSRELCIFWGDDHGEDTYSCSDVEGTFTGEQVRQFGVDNPSCQVVVVVYGSLDDIEAIASS